MSAGMAAPRQPIEELSRSASTPIVLAICGDPVVGRALVLLLRSSLYDTKFISISFLSDAGALEGVRLVLLTPMWEFYGGDHEALSAPLRAAWAPPDGIGTKSMLPASPAVTRAFPFRVTKLASRPSAL